MIIMLWNMYKIQVHPPALLASFDFGSVALLSDNTLKWSAILGLSFFCAVLVAQGIHATEFKHTYLVNFALHFEKC